MFKLINEYFEYDNLRVQRRQHECIFAKRKRRKSGINLNVNISKNILEGKYISQNNDKNKIKEEKIKTNDEDKKENKDYEDYEDMYLNNLYYDFI